MPSLSLSLSRPVVTVGLSTLLVGSLVLSGCSSPSKETASPSAVPTTPVTSKPLPKPAPKVPKPKPAAPFASRGVPADLAAVIRPLYLGGVVASSPSARRALHLRKIGKAAGPVTVRGAVSTWRGVPIAVITRGKDVTLAVKAPRWRVVGGWWPSVGVSSPSLGGSSRRVLVVGSDARKGQPVGRSRADSIHIVGFDGHGGGGIVGIARDAYVPLATGGQGKINSALVFGGPLALQRTVSSATGVRLDGYLMTGFDGFRRLVNGIGGLALFFPGAIIDRDAQANIKAGARRLSGRQALAYARARHAVPGGDFGRSANQGRLILAAAGLTDLVGPAKLPGILRKAAPLVSTNLSAEQVLTFAAGVYVTSPKKVHNRVAAGGFGMTSDGQSIVILDGQARRLFADIRDGNLS